AIVAATMGGSVLAACDSKVADTGAGPTVSAGADAATNSGRVVTLTGTATGGNGLSTAWSQLSGPTVTLDSAASNTATFIAPSV
ncbi:phosphatase, partial [Escherichia coli]|nr:phosphatase [Escherichia coli]